MEFGEFGPLVDVWGLPTEQNLRLRRFNRTFSQAVEFPPGAGVRGESCRKRPPEEPRRMHRFGPQEVFAGWML